MSPMASSRRDIRRPQPSPWRLPVTATHRTAVAWCILDCSPSAASYVDAPSVAVDAVARSSVVAASA